VAAATQDAARPHNDLFSRRVKLVCPLTCGELQNSTIEPGESLIAAAASGTAGIITPAPIRTSRSLCWWKHLSVYRGNQITNLVPVSVDSASFSYHSGTNENLFLRIYDTDYPPSGDIQIAMDTGTNFYLGQFYITPAPLSRIVCPSTRPACSSAQLTSDIHNGSVSPEAPEFMGMVLTNSANLQFLVQFPDGSSFVVKPGVPEGDHAQLTRSQAFKEAVGRRNQYSARGVGHVIQG